MSGKGLYPKEDIYFVGMECGEEDWELTEYSRAALGEDVPCFRAADVPVGTIVRTNLDGKVAIILGTEQSKDCVVLCYYLVEIEANSLPMDDPDKFKMTWVEEYDGVISLGKVKWADK